MVVRSEHHRIPTVLKNCSPHSQMPSEVTHPLIELPVMVSLAAASVAANAGPYMMPLLIGAIASHQHSTVAVVGRIFSIEIFAIAVPSLLLAPRIHRLNRRRLAQSSALLVIVGYLLAALAPNMWLLAVSRIVAGLGEGGLMAAVAAIASGLVRPERVFAMLNLATILMSLAVYLGVPELVLPFGYPAGFAAVCAPAAAAFFLTRRLPPFALQQTPDAALASRGQLPKLAWGICASLLIFVVGSNITFYFTEQIGTIAYAMSLRDIGNSLAIASVIALAGPPLAARAVARWGHRAPNVCALLLSAIVAWVLTESNHRPIFFGTVALSAMITFFLMSSLMAWAASASPDGRIATAAQGVSVLGNSLTPLMGGAILAAYGVSQVGWFAVGCLMASALGVCVFQLGRQPAPVQIITP
jgi:DHA1 family inner membrane transport protein